MAATRTKLPDACVAEALAIINEAGLEGLSLREVARRLGVSHQAPYKHYPSRDHLLAEVVGRAFASFAEALDARPRTGDPMADLRSMGRAYLSYAFAHPLQYRLMFGTPLPDADRHPAMLAQARHPFALLQEALRMVVRASGGTVVAARIDADALFVWSTMHGLASALQTSAIATLAVSPDVLAGMTDHVLDAIRTALSAPRPRDTTR